MQLPCKALRTAGVFVAGAVRVVGHAHDQCVGLPFGNALGDAHEARIALGPDGGLRTGRAQQPVTHRHPRALETKIKSEKGLKVRRNRWGFQQWCNAAHAWPAPGDRRHASSPSKPRAVS